MSEFAERLRAARIERGYEEASEFAAILGVSPHRYRHWERGKISPPYDMLVRLCHVLRKDTNYFFPAVADVLTTSENNEAKRTTNAA